MPLHLAGLDPGAVIVGLIIVTALLLFFTEKVPIDITAIGIIVTLAALGQWTGITPEEALSGFSSKATITILSFFIISEGVRQTGVVQMISRKISSYTGSNETKQVAALTSLSGTFSGVINNAAVVSVLIPVASDLADRADISPSKLLMPMSFVAISAGQLTLIASTDNLIISDISARMLDHPIGMFELTGLGFLMMLTAILYFLTIGYRLVPDTGSGTSLLEFDIKNYVTEITVPEDSPFIGSTVAEVMEEVEVNIDILEVRGTTYSTPRDHRLRAGDVLEIVTDEESLMKLLDRKGIELVPETAEAHEELESEENAYTLIRAMLPPNSSLIGETLASTHFRQHYQASVLAIRRKTDILQQKLKDTILRAGDVLLLQTSEENIDELAENANFVLDRGFERTSFKSDLAGIASIIVSGVIGLTALGILPVEIAGLAGVVAMVATGCISPHQIYRNVDWNVIFLISGVIPLGIAMENVGLASGIASLLTGLGGSLSAVWMLVLVYAISQLTTSLINDNAAMVLMAPIAVETARAIGADPFSFILAVLFAGGTAVLTPMGFQTNLMIYGPGGYSFRDFLKVGLPLNLLLSVVVLLGILTFWGV